MIRPAAILAVLWALACAAPVLAQPVYPGARAPVDTSAPPYSAVGLLQFDDGVCSGALIGEAVVLTAAHCLIREDALALDGVFVTAAGRPDGPLTAGLSDARVLPGLDRGGEVDAALLRNGDWALVRLDRPLGAQAGVLDVVAAVDNRPRRPDLIGALAMVLVCALAAAATHGRVRVALAGLAGLGLILLAAMAVRAALAPDWRAAPVLQAGFGPSGGQTLYGGPACNIVRFRPSGLIEHDCVIYPGDSGSPLLVRHDGGWAVTAVISHVQFTPDGPRAWATAAAAVPDPDAAFARGGDGSPAAD